MGGRNGWGQSWGAGHCCPVKGNVGLNRCATQMFRGVAHQLIATPLTRKAPDKHCVFSGDATVAVVRIPIAGQSLVAISAHALRRHHGLNTWRVP